MRELENEDPWIAAMRRGDFAAAWEISDALLETKRAQDHTTVPRHFQTIWDGRPLAGQRVLVRCYHGLGDTIQFIRYAALLKRIAAQVIVWAQPTLIPLLRNVEGIDQLLPLHDGTPDAEYDVDVELGELPYVFRTMPETIPANVPYLHVEPARLQQDERLTVGLIWQSGDWNTSRSIPFAEIQSLAHLPDIDWHLRTGALLPGTAGVSPACGAEDVKRNKQARRLRSPARARPQRMELAGIDWHILQREARRAGWDGKLGHISGGYNPLDDARIMSALDLVISVDTMTAHLAGALGRNTWTLLPHEADWRWMVDRDDSPWYPTMRLFRQQQEGKWDTVIREVAAELIKVAALNRRPSAAGHRDL